MKDKVLPADKWEFNQEVTDVFDDMLKRSIPDYDKMRNLCFRIGSNFLYKDSTVIDLGCSRGEAIAEFVKHFPEMHYLGLEISEPMFQAASARFEGEENVNIMKMDLRNKFPSIEANLILSVLTVMFVPIEHRQRIIKSVWGHLAPGGGFIFVEKTLGSSSDINELFIKEYYKEKKQRGYTEEQIERKRLSLEGVLVPITTSWNEELLHQAGFTYIECFWKWMNFTAWIAIK